MHHHKEYNFLVIFVELQYRVQSVTAFPALTRISRELLALKK